MKTKTAIYSIIISLIAVVTFFSCDNPVSLGTKLDILGPVVTILSPSQRQSVPVQFEIEGTVYDDSLIERILITAVQNNLEFQRQWRYYGGIWQISDDYGASWSVYDGVSCADSGRFISWKLTVDMVIDGRLAGEGEFTFNIQAWDRGGMSDDNSFKALVLIIDIDPPKVVITNPYLYGKYAYETDTDFIKFDAMPDLSDEWKDPAYLGKFITQEFPLKWQIEDINNIWSINLSFYRHDTDIDNDPDTPLPDNYIYRYYKNLPPPPSDAVNPNDYVKLNGSVTVPNLYDNPGFYDEGGELKNPVAEKLTVKVVAVCFDAAGNPNQEKTLGYFISWPRANSPWIVFSEGLEPPDSFYDRRVAYDNDDPDTNQDYIEKDVYTVYPGRSIKATAFQAHGVKEAKYSLYKCDTSGNKLNRPERLEDLEKIEINVIKPNTAYGGTFSSIHPWDFNVPVITGYYIFTAEAFSSQGKSNEDYGGKYVMLFRVHDISFPDFTEGPFPVASEPLFMDIRNNKITIHGVVSDITNVVSLCMVWIDPESKDYAAMSQLSYFRDKDYKGWQKALTLTPGATDLENDNESYDKYHKNRLWMINLAPAIPPIDNETNRRRFSYSQVIDLDVLNIAANKQPLKSQVFLLRAQNPDGKCTIITYAPQGDTFAPEIKITNVLIPSAPDPTLIPGKYAVVPKFENGNTITINGTWREDSLEILPIDSYFKQNFNITINNQPMPLPVLTSNSDKTTGTWTLTATVGTPGGSNDGKIAQAVLKDTLVIGASVKDIGGNVSETSCSWLIESDNLRLMRISSEVEDGIYAAGKQIDLFLEFSKPVKLTNPGMKPELILSSAGGNAARAVYKDGQTNQNSRQYFTYTIGANHSTDGGWLNVTGLYYNGVYSASTPFNTSGYPFTWSKGVDGVEGYEEVRITMAKNPNPVDPSYDSYDGNSKAVDGIYYPRTLPVTTATNHPDYQFTLTAGKHIEIDTAPLTVSSVTSTDTGYHNTGGDIYITVKFNKAVTILSGVPRLTLQVANSGISTVQTSAEPKYVRVNGIEITFMYSIKGGDTTSGNPVIVSNLSGGTIADLAGNQLTSFGESRLAGVFIETLPPGTPTFRILSDYTPNPTQDNQCIMQNINGSDIYGRSTTSDVDLANVYNNDLYYTIQGNTSGDNASAQYKVGTLEYAYSTNYGTPSVSWSSWVAFNTTNTPQTLSQTGKSTFKARQKDKAGNVSAETNAVTLNWDKGTLISRINSTNANGTYTNTTNNGGSKVDRINITVYFRKKVKFSAYPSITLNTTPTATVTLKASDYTLNNAVDSLSFPYDVGPNDYTGGSTKLDVTTFNLNSGNAQDESNVRVNNQLVLPQTGSGSRLSDFKDIYVQTGPLEVDTPIAFSSEVSNPGIATDGSYNTAITVSFKRNIYKGSGNITIIQSPTNYRLPAVLTETQFSKYTNVPNVEKYYTRGSNGYIYTSTTDRKADTSTKYILKYDVDTAAAANAPNKDGTEIQKLAEAFRQAEKIELSIYAQAVRTSGTKLIVELTGTNALQVPGASYLITYPAGFVQDSLSTPCPAINAQSLPLGGTAKPFIRINKRQDSITTQTGTATAPSLVAKQPFQADVRFDCRTPGSTIYYIADNTKVTTTNTMNWNYNANPASNGPNDLTNPALPDRPGVPSTSSSTTNPITIGTNNDYQGLQWYCRARAYKDSTWSLDSDEMAFKTVITYVINSMPGTVASPTDNGIGPVAGDQIWIRGGDAVGLSSVPGFPINWDVAEFEAAKAEKRRAGIRLFTLDSVGSSLANSSTWKFITWEINVDTYFDIILGKDTTSSAEEALQYGPRQFAYQRAGWTSYKEQFRALPGKHRWLVSDNPTGGNTKGTLNFSGTFGARPQYTGTDITYKQP